MQSEHWGVHYGSFHVMRLEAGLIWDLAALDLLLISKQKRSELLRKQQLRAVEAVNMHFVTLCSASCSALTKSQKNPAC